MRAAPKLSLSDTYRARESVTAKPKDDSTLPPVAGDVSKSQADRLHELAAQLSDEAVQHVAQELARDGFTGNDAYTLLRKIGGRVNEMREGKHNG